MQPKYNFYKILPYALELSHNFATDFVHFSQ